MINFKTITMKLHFYKFLIALALLVGSAGVLNAQVLRQTYNPANIVKEPPVQDKNGLSDKRLVSMTEQLKSNATTIRLGNGVSLISGLVDLGDGMSLLGTDVDANSTLAVMTVNSSQWANLLDGNNYNFSGELVNITNTIYSKFKDDFDFIFYVLDMPQDNNVINALGFYGINMGVSNNIQGLGMSAYNNTSYWGSTGKLKSVMYFPYADAILFGPTLHELSHNWAAFIVPTYDENNNPFGGHWGISNAGGQLGGFKYVREVEQNSGGVTGKTKYQASFSSNETNPDGSFKYPGFGSFANGGNGLPYSDIELYLMGMKSAQDLRNAGFHLDIYSGNSYDDVNSFYGNGYFYSTTKTSYSIDNIISLVGARVPDASSSQKHFKILTVAISQESAGTHYYSNIITAVNWLAGPQSDQTYYPWLYNFSQATYGAGSLETGGVSSSLKSILPATITLNKTSASITEGQTEQLTATVSSGETPTWSSDNTPVATVSSTGLVTAVSAGNATITATISGGISATCAVTVTAGGSTSPCSNPTASGTTGGLTWTLCPDGTLTISGQGAMPDYQLSINNPPWYSNNSNITKVIIENGVTTIGSMAFTSLANLTSITLSTSVTSFNGNLCERCSNLLEINVDNNNSNFSSIDGVLFNKDGTTLIRCPEGKTGVYSIPSSVSTIGNGALEFSRLSSVNIPASVTTVEYGAFWSCENLTEINVNGGTSFISSNGILYNYDHTFLVAYPGGKPETSFSIPSTVSIITQNAFVYCKNLTSINIPNSVKNIEFEAFFGCTGLTSLNIPESVTYIGNEAFMACSNLISAIIPKSIQNVGERAFRDCSSLKSMSVNWDTPLIITANIFENVNISKITLYVPVGTKSLYEASDVWKDFGTIVEQSNTSPCNNPTASGTTGGLTWTLCPDGTLTISGNGPMPDYDWYTTPWNNYKESIANVVISDGVDNISKLAFWNCQKMTAITIPNSVTTIGYYALNQTGLTAITIPNSVTSIGISAFENCNNLTSITIPNSVVNIGIGAFRRCANLNTINADAANPEYLSIDGILFSKDQATLVAYPAGKENNSYDIPTSVNTIGDGAFSGSSNLTSITIPNSVTAINSGAFSECTGLTSVTIPNTVTSIGIVAFSNCANLLSINVDTANPAYLSIDGVLFNKDQTTLVEYPEGKTNDSYVIPTSVTSIYHGAFWSSNLTSITIPASVTSIESVAFISSDKLTDVIVEWTTPLSIPDNVFQSTSISAGTLHVPAGTTALYQAAPVWKDFGTIVDDVILVSADTKATETVISWQEVPTATSYNLTVYKDEAHTQVFGSYNINASSQAQAPTRLTLRSGDSRLSYKVTGLSSETTYWYTLTAFNNTTAIAVFSESFVTTGNTTPKSGDINGDGNVTPADAGLILQRVAGKITFTAAQQIAADVNNSGDVTPADAGLVLQRVAGKIAKFPVEP